MVDVSHKLGHLRLTAGFQAFDNPRNIIGLLVLAEFKLGGDLLQRINQRLPAEAGAGPFEKPSCPPPALLVVADLFFATNLRPI